MCVCVCVCVRERERERERECVFVCVWKIEYVARLFGVCVRVFNPGASTLKLFIYGRNYCRKLIYLSIWN